VSGNTIELILEAVPFCPSGKPDDLTIYMQDKPIAKLGNLNIHENANPPHPGIRFHSSPEEQS